MSAGGAGLGTAQGRIEIDVGQAVSSLNQLSSAMGSFDSKAGAVGQQGGQGLLGMSSAAQAVGRDMAVLGAAFAVPLVAGIKSAAELEQGLANIGAVGGAEATAAMDEIRETALQLGADTSFSAGEAAAGMEELIKAGIPVEDVLNGAAKGAINLAEAAGTEVAPAAEIMSNALNVFGDDMEGFNTVGEQAAHVADVFAGAANQSAADVGELGTSMKQVALVASQTNQGFEETTATLSLMADAGLTGSDAGTSLRTTLLRLAAPTDKAAELMNHLGLNFRDAEGNMKPLAGIADELQNKLAGLTQAERDHAFQVIFGSDAIRAANVLYKEGGEAIQQRTEDISESGIAAETAAKRMDTLQGDLDKLGAAWDSASQGLTAALMPALREVVQAITGVVNAFGQLPGPIQAAVGVIAALAAGLLTVGGGALFFAGRIAESLAAIRAFSTAVTAAGGVLPLLATGFQAIAGAVAAGAASFVAFAIAAAPVMILLGAVIGITALVVKASQDKAAALDAEREAWEKLNETISQIEDPGAQEVAEGTAERLESLGALDEATIRVTENSIALVEKWRDENVAAGMDVTEAMNVAQAKWAEYNLTIDESTRSISAIDRAFAAAGDNLRETTEGVDALVEAYAQGDILGRNMTKGLEDMATILEMTGQAGKFMREEMFQLFDAFDRGDITAEQLAAGIGDLVLNTEEHVAVAARQAEMVETARQAMERQRLEGEASADTYERLTATLDDYKEAGSDAFATVSRAAADAAYDQVILAGGDVEDALKAAQGAMDEHGKRAEALAGAYRGVLIPAVQGAAGVFAQVLTPGMDILDWLSEMPGLAGSAAEGFTQVADAINDSAAAMSGVLGMFATLDNLGKISAGAASLAESLVGAPGEWAEIDNMATRVWEQYNAGTISLGEAEAAQAKYNAAVDAGYQIQADNVAVQQELNEIRAGLLPLLAEQSAAYKQQITDLGNLSLEEQQRALYLMDSANQAKLAAIESTRYSAAVGEIPTDVATDIIVSAAQADPILKDLLLDYGIIEEGAEGVVTVNFPEGQSVQATIQELTDAVDFLNNTIIMIHAEETGATELLNRIKAIGDDVTALPESKTITFNAVDGTVRMRQNLDAVAAQDGQTFTSYFEIVSAGFEDVSEGGEQLFELDGNTYTATFNAETGETTLHLAEVEGQMEGLDGKTATGRVEITGGTEAASAVEGTADAMGEVEGKTATGRVIVEGGPEAEAAVEGAAAATEGFDGSTATGTLAVTADTSAVEAAASEYQGQTLAQAIIEVVPQIAQGVTGLLESGAGLLDELAADHASEATVSVTVERAAFDTLVADVEALADKSVTVTALVETTAYDAFILATQNATASVKVTAELDSSAVDDYTPAEVILPVVTSLDDSTASGFTPGSKTLDVSAALDASGVSGYDPGSKTLTVVATVDSSAVDSYSPTPATLAVNAVLNTVAVENYTPQPKTMEVIAEVVMPDQPNVQAPKDTPRPNVQAPEGQVIPVGSVTLKHAGGDMPLELAPSSQVVPVASLPVDTSSVSVEPASGTASTMTDALATSLAAEIGGAPVEAFAPVGEALATKLQQGLAVAMREPSQTISETPQEIPGGGMANAIVAGMADQLAAGAGTVDPTVFAPAAAAIMAKLQEGIAVAMRQPGQTISETPQEIPGGGMATAIITSMAQQLATGAAAVPPTVFTGAAAAIMAKLQEGISAALSGGGGDTMGGPGERGGVGGTGQGMAGPIMQSLAEGLASGVQGADFSAVGSAIQVKIGAALGEAMSGAGQAGAAQGGEAAGGAGGAIGTAIAASLATSVQGADFGTVGAAISAKISEAISSGLSSAGGQAGGAGAAGGNTAVGQAIAQQVISSVDGADWSGLTTSFQTHATAAATGFQTGIVTGMAGAITSIQGSVAQMNATLAAMAGTATTAGQSAGTGFQTGITTGMAGAITSTQGAAAQINATLAAIAGEATAAGNAAGTGFQSGIVQGMAAAITSVQGAVAQIIATLDSAASSAAASGAAVSAGFAAGIRSGIADAAAAAGELAAAGTVGVSTGIAEGSPSRITRESGENFSRGFIEGIRMHVPAAIEAGRELAEAGVGGMQGLQMPGNLGDGILASLGNLRGPVRDIKGIANELSNIPGLEDFGGNLDELAAKIRDRGGQAKDRTQDMVNEITDLFKELREQAREEGRRAGEAVGNEVAGGIASSTGAVGEATGNLAREVTSQIRGMLDGITQLTKSDLRVTDSIIGDTRKLQGDTKDLHGIARELSKIPGLEDFGAEIAEIADRIEARGGDIRDKTKEVADTMAQVFRDQRKVMRKVAEDLGKEIANGIDDGLKSKVDATEKAGSTVGASAATGINDGITAGGPGGGTWNVGNAAGGQLASGLESTTGEAEAAGQAVGEAAATGLEQGLGTSDDAELITDSTVTDQTTAALEGGTQVGQAAATGVVQGLEQSGAADAVSEYFDVLFSPTAEGTPDMDFGNDALVAIKEISPELYEAARAAGVGIAEAFDAGASTTELNQMRADAEAELSQLAQQLGVAGTEAGSSVGTDVGTGIGTGLAASAPSVQQIGSQVVQQVMTALKASAIGDSAAVQQAGEILGNAFGQGVSTAGTEVAADGSSLPADAAQGISTGTTAAQPSVTADGAALGDSFGDGLEQGSGGLQRSGNSLTDQAAEGIDNGLPGAENTATNAGQEIGSGLESGLEDNCKSVDNAATDLADKCGGGGIESGADAASGDATDAGQQLGEDFADGLGDMEKDAEKAGGDLGQAGAEALEEKLGAIDPKKQIETALAKLDSLKAGAGTDGSNIGEAFGQGLADGAANKSSIINTAVKDLIDKAYAAGKKAANAKSPSKLFAELGADLTLGAAKGVADNIPAAASAMAGVVEAMATEAAGMGGVFAGIAEESRGFVATAAGHLAGSSMRNLLTRVQKSAIAFGLPFEEMLWRINRSAAGRGLGFTGTGVQSAQDAAVVDSRPMATGQTTNARTVQIGSLKLEPGQRGFDEAMALADALDETVVAVWQ